MSFLKRGSLFFPFFFFHFLSSYTLFNFLYELYWINLYDFATLKHFAEIWWFLREKQLGDEFGKWEFRFARFEIIIIYVIEISIVSFFIVFSQIVSILKYLEGILVVL